MKPRYARSIRLLGSAAVFVAVLLAVLPQTSQAAGPAEDDAAVRKALKETLARSDAMSAQALLVLGGSVAALLSSSYLQPRRRRTRLMYLLFLPSWGLLMWSLYSGHEVERIYIRALHLADESPLKYQLDVLWRLEEQSSGLYLSLFPLALWLVLFLFWWISQGSRRNESSKKTQRDDA